LHAARMACHRPTEVRPPQTPLRRILPSYTMLNVGFARRRLNVSVCMWPSASFLCVLRLNFWVYTEVYSDVCEWLLLNVCLFLTYSDHTLFPPSLLFEFFPSLPLPLPPLSLSILGDSSCLFRPFPTFPPFGRVSQRAWWLSWGSWASLYALLVCAFYARAWWGEKTKKKK
jgi:hypothetical protein